MALNIKDSETEQLATEVALLTGENKTQAVRNALRERRERLQSTRTRMSRAQRIKWFLENEAWPQLPEDATGRTITKADREDILGYGPEGV